MPLKRKKTFVVFREARKVGAYDERPMLPDDIHIQVHLSRADHPQPFYLVCEKDTLLLVFAGEGRVEMKDTGVLYFPLQPGDHVYVPAGTPTRIVPTTELTLLRYKAREAGLEGVAWYCDACGEPIHRHVFDTAETSSQQGYVDGVRAFNEDAVRRSCGCGWEHPPVELERYRWTELADALRS